jgi:predicted phosphodiesterase
VAQREASGRTRTTAIQIPIPRVGDVLVVNPGAAGHRRFDLHPSVARLRIDDGGAEVVLVTLPG